MAMAAASLFIRSILILPDYDQLVDHRLDIVDSPHELFQLYRLFLAPHAALEPDPAALALGPDAGFGEAAGGEDGFFHAWDDFLVVEICVRQPAASRQETARATLGARVRLGPHLGLGDE